MLSILSVMVLSSSLYAEKGKVRVSCNVEDAYVYVNSKKKAMIGEGFTDLLLKEGEYKIRVQKPINKDYEYIGKKTIFVGEDTSSKINIKLHKVKTAKKRAQERQYERVDKDIVYDKNTNLMWQDNSASRTKKLTYAKAIDYCKNLKIGKYSDWRLPKRTELQSIVDHKRNAPAILKAFKHTASYYYWSVTSYAHDTKQAWNINFYYGDRYSYDKDNKSYVRCVRGK